MTPDTPPCDTGGAPAPGGRQPPPASFESAYELAEAAVDRLEQGELSLAESLEEYERGLKSIRRCYEALAQAQKRIEVLSGDAGGSAWEPAESHPGVKEAVDQVEREEDLPPAP